MKWDDGKTVNVQICTDKKKINLNREEREKEKREKPINGLWNVNKCVIEEIIEDKKTYFRPKTIAKIIAKTATTIAIIPIIINNFFKWKRKIRR